MKSMYFLFCGALIGILTYMLWVQKNKQHIELIQAVQIAKKEEQERLASEYEILGKQQHELGLMLGRLEKEAEWKVKFNRTVDSLNILHVQTVDALKTAHLYATDLLNAKFNKKTTAYEAQIIDYTNQLRSVKDSNQVLRDKLIKMKALREKQPKHDFKTRKKLDLHTAQMPWSLCSSYASLSNGNSSFAALRRFLMFLFQASILALFIFLGTKRILVRYQYQIRLKRRFS